jgi:hypothetical protein
VSVAGFAFGTLALAVSGWCFRDPVAMIGTFLVCSLAAHFTSTPTSHRLTPGNSSSSVVRSTSLIRNGTTPR